MNTIARPSRADIESIGSHYAVSVLDKMPQRPRKTLESMINTSNTHALDLIHRLLIFAPHRRLTVEQCLVHPYKKTHVKRIQHEKIRVFFLTEPATRTFSFAFLVHFQGERPHSTVIAKPSTPTREMMKANGRSSSGTAGGAPIAQAECSDTDYDTARSLARAA
ncbi:unnamed protein product, partial [Cylicostephanus goldi]